MPRGFSRRRGQREWSQRRNVLRLAAQSPGAPSAQSGKLVCGQLRRSRLLRGGAGTIRRRPGNNEEAARGMVHRSSHGWTSVASCGCPRVTTDSPVCFERPVLRLDADLLLRWGTRLPGSTGRHERNSSFWRSLRCVLAMGILIAADSRVRPASNGRQGRAVCRISWSGSIRGNPV